MFDDRVGTILRAIRIRRGLRQVDVARLAFVSDATVSRIERGHLEDLSLRTIRRVARVLEVQLQLNPWSRHGDLHRFATAGHAEVVESVIHALIDCGWEPRAEVSFSFNGERGFIDVLAWHAHTRTVLVIEIKTEIVDVGEAVGTLDRKRRLAARVAREQGWEPANIACALIVEDTRTNRRRVGAHRATFGSLLPGDARTVRALMRNPGRAAARDAVSGVAFWTLRHPGTVRQPRAGARRVRKANSCSGAASAGP
jgi:transcriptional regulator with XRE-family HTH domain